ncbi:SLC13 family permease [Desulfobaculum bizertense]|uniref:SLC13 family permease n=1 Tax=Desulfobaculum bizertense TaxID=376490 RepID=UPI001F2E8D5C|nr:SLC13 family permease [Desulfobaculum bizertense]UIJ37451.1 SLC13 family permease [Desulfobaculum bizertense]
MKKLCTFGLLACALVLVLATTAYAAPVPSLTHAYLTLIILFVAAILFFSELVPLPITAMLVPVALSAFGIIPAKEAFINFGNQWVVIFMGMFVVGEATFVTGFAEKIGLLTLKFSKGKESRVLILSMLAVGVLSAFLSNTGTIVVAIPMIMGMCATAKIKPGKILMPVAFAASLGGTMTLVGTPPNGLVNSVLEQMGPAGVEPFGFFEFAKIGAILFAAGIIYYAVIGRRFLPDEVKECEMVEVQKPKRPEKMWWSVGIFIFVVVAMVSKLLPLVTAVMLGACLVVITGCMTVNEAYRAVDWTTIFLFAGMLSMSTAMKDSGAAQLIADNVVKHVSNPYMLLAVCCALTAMVTNFMSNTATAALMAPLAIPIAVNGGVSPLPLVMGIAMSASACFLTPVATPPNTIVLGPGRYSFLDYTKAGWPLQLISFVLIVIFVPMIWPF